MSEKPYYKNPFNVWSPSVNAEVLRLKEYLNKRVSESSTLQEGVLIMSSKIIEMTRLLSECLVTGDMSQMDQCAAFAREVHKEEKVLTKYLVHSGVSGNILQGVLGFPYRLERIGDLLENLLRCCRTMHQSGIQFSDRAMEQLKELFTLVIEALNNLQDAFCSPIPSLPKAISARGKTVPQIIDYFRSEHWERVEAGQCSPEASSLYLDILDSIKWTYEYTEEMRSSLIELCEEHQRQAEGEHAQTS
jgi:Na+/phosphate symporter